MADGRHIENRFLAVSQFIVRLMRNLPWWSTIMFWHRTRDQISQIPDGGWQPFWK